MQRKEITSSLLSGFPACWSASTFDGSGLMPSLEIITPQNGIDSLANEHFSAFKVKPERWIVARMESIT